MGRIVYGEWKTGDDKREADETLASCTIDLAPLDAACDALATPRPLAPFLDVAEVTGGELQTLATEGAKPYEFAAVLMRDLRERAPLVVVVEDLHWADAATLDVLRILARRIESVGVLVVGTFRDDELDRKHPLRTMLGDLPAAGAISRIRLAPLSEHSVAHLAEPFGVDAAQLYRQTSGNPFFVTEVLAGGTQAVPATVQDAVLARIARLSSAGRSLVEAASIIPATAEFWLLERLCPGGMGSVEAFPGLVFGDPFDRQVLSERAVGNLRPAQLLAPAGVVRSRIREDGHLGPSACPEIMAGAANWKVEGGEGQFAEATGLITSNFTLTETGEINDYHFGVIFVP